MEKKKKDLMLYQWLFITPFSILGALGALIVGIMALLIFITSAKYVVASFMLESAKIFPAFVLTVISLGVVAALVYSEIILIKKYIKSMREFLAEKKQILTDSDKKEN
ncbi:MAG: hypothetical protein K2O95_06455 [Clostridia bacterium]|nr:hypothetical protein [Clostridia bacterium]MDE7079738.1 hypothetical protein [Clostridia bacterium]